jgi:hypothetical protein
MLRPTLLLMFLLLTVTVECSGQDRSYGRSVVMTDRGIVATSHYLASQAGARFWPKAGRRWTPLLLPMSCWESPSP